jgi:hypothetical protein
VMLDDVESKLKSFYGGMHESLIYRLINAQHSSCSVVHGDCAFRWLGHMQVGGVALFLLFAIASLKV